MRCAECGSPRLVRHRTLAALTLAHIDCDAFYATVEKRDNPDIADKPVIIGGGKRGVVSAACYIARTYGVRSAMPMFKALDLCPSAIVVRPDMAKYVRVGREVRQAMMALTPLVEPLSIDEAFLDLSGTTLVHGMIPAKVLARFAAKVDKNELLARARTQIRKRRYTDHLRDNVQNSIEMAITDPLTGLHNRRYMESHLSTLAEQASLRAKPLALMMLDIDYFKSINDRYGHDAGDDVLREFAVRIRKSIRGIDLACRYGGEEFVIVMPETDLHVAGMVAERLRRSIAGEPFSIEKGAKRIDVTISIGISTLETKGEAIGDVLKRADQALYRAKNDGRNRVVAAAA